MFSLGRRWPKLYLQTHSSRCYRLTTTEISGGLKPLLIKIHPDLFASYPDIQDVNSRSIGSLQGWLDQLNNQVLGTPKLVTSFYLKQESSTRLVSVVLEPTEIREALENLFEQLGLRRTHLEYVMTKANNKRNHQHVEFDEDLHMFSIFREKDVVRSLNTDPSLTEWLKKHLEKAKIEHKKYDAARVGVNARMEEIRSILKLRDLTWCSVWGLPIQSGVIRSLYVLVCNHKEKLKHLEGAKVLLCDLQHTTLASDRGAQHTICLSVIDQAEDWKRFFLRYQDTELSSLIKETRNKEDEIRKFLGGIKILRPGALGAVGGVTVSRPIEILLYTERIDILLQSLRKHNKPIDMDLSTFKLEINIAQFETGYMYQERLNVKYEPVYLLITDYGSFEIRYDVDPESLTNLMEEKISEAKERKDLFQHLKRRESFLQEKLMEEYKLTEVSRGYGMPVSKMVDCCQRLLNSGVLDKIDLEGCKIMISKDYRRNSDGYLVLKWDWR